VGRPPHAQVPRPRDADLASVPAGGVTRPGAPPALRTASSRRPPPACRRCGRRWRRS
jgi:hypothetical protein